VCAEKNGKKKEREEQQEWSGRKEIKYEKGFQGFRTLPVRMGAADSGQAFPTGKV